MMRSAFAGSSVFLRVISGASWDVAERAFAAACGKSVLFGKIRGVYVRTRAASRQSRIVRAVRVFIYMLCNMHAPDMRRIGGTLYEASHRYLRASESSFIRAMLRGSVKWTVSSVATVVFSALAVNIAVDLALKKYNWHSFHTGARLGLAFISLFLACSRPGLDVLLRSSLIAGLFRSNKDCKFKKVL